MKTCIYCNIKKSKENFIKNTNGCKDCKREYGKIWRDKNKKKSANYSVEWRKENKEYIAEKKRIYHIENRDKIIKKVKKWEHENKDKAKLRRRKHYQDNKDRIEFKGKIYRSKNKEQKKEYDKKYMQTEKGIAVGKSRTANRRARKKYANGVLTKEMATILVKNCNDKCYWCGKKLNAKYHLDHYVPLVRGGHNTIDNMVVSCPKCNLTKNKKDPIKFANSIGKLL